MSLNWVELVHRSPATWQRLVFGNAFEQRVERGLSELPLLSVTGESGVVLRDDLGRRDTSSADKSRYLRVMPGDAVYNTMRMWQGVSGISALEGITSPAYTVCKPASTIDPSYAGYLLKFPPLVREFHSRSQGIVDDTLSLKYPKFAEIPLSLPSLQEQRRIAEILSSVDKAVAATREVTEQARVVKQGVLERLLTKGIGHTRFKQTEIGVIPAGWEVATLEELLADIPNPMRSGPFGSALKSEELVDSGVPFLGIDNIQIEKFVSNYKRFLSEDKFRQLRRFAVNPNDVVITIMGTVGRCCVIPPDIGEAVSSKHIWAMSLHNERYIPELACWQMNFAPWIVSKFTTSAQGGIMSAINSGILRKLVFPVPALEEQRQILQVWQSFQSQLQVEQAKLKNLEELKSALMSDLLTGRKRVTDALLMAAE